MYQTHSNEKMFVNCARIRPLAMVEVVSRKRKINITRTMRLLIGYYHG